MTNVLWGTGLGFAGFKYGFRGARGLLRFGGRATAGAARMGARFGAWGFSRAGRMADWGMRGSAPWMERAGIRMAELSMGIQTRGANWFTQGAAKLGYKVGRRAGVAAANIPTQYGRARGWWQTAYPAIRGAAHVGAQDVRNWYGGLGPFAQRATRIGLYGAAGVMAYNIMAPAIEPMLDRGIPEPDYGEKMRLDDMGASGDLVMALHNLR